MPCTSHHQTMHVIAIHQQSPFILQQIGAPEHIERYHRVMIPLLQTAAYVFAVACGLGVVLFVLASIIDLLLPDRFLKAKNLAVAVSGWLFMGGFFLCGGIGCVLFYL